jgi:hypothetical protein
MLTSWYWRVVYSNTLTIKQMDQHTYDNWVRIKETFEVSGNTDNMFYKRACAIVKTGKDPLAKILGDEKNV